MPSLDDHISIRNISSLSITRGAVARHQVIDDLVELLPRRLAIGMAAVKADIPLWPAFIGVDLPMHHTGDGAFDRCHFAEHFPHAWHLVSPNGIAHVMASLRWSGASGM